MSDQETGQTQEQNQSDVDDNTTDQLQMQQENPVAGEHQQPMSGPHQQPMFGPYQHPMAGLYQQPLSGPYQQPMTGPYQQPLPGPYHQPIAVPYQQPMVGPYQQPMPGTYQQPMTGPYQQPMVSPYQQPIVGQYQQSMSGPHQRDFMEQQPSQPIQPVQWNTDAPVFIPRSDAVRNKSGTPLLRDVQDSTAINVQTVENQKEVVPAPQNSSLEAIGVETVLSQKLEETRQESTSVTRTEGAVGIPKTTTERPCTTKLEDVIPLRADEVARPLFSATPESQHALGSNQVQKMPDRELPSASEQHKIHLNATVGYSSIKDIKLVEQIDRRLSTVTIEKDSSPVVSTLSTQLRIEPSAFEGHSEEQQVNQIRLTATSSFTKSARVTDGPVAHKTRHNPPRPPVVDSEGFQFPRNSLVSQLPQSATSLNQLQEQLRKQELRQRQELCEAQASHQQDVVDVERGECSASNPARDNKSLERVQRSLKKQKQQDQKAEKLAKERKVEEEDEAALSEAIAVKENYRDMKEQLRVALKKYQKTQSNRRLLFRISNYTLPDTIEMPWILRDVLLFWKQYQQEEGMEKEVSEFLKNRLSHWRNVTTLTDEDHNGWIAIYELLIELQDEVVLQDFKVLQEMFHGFADYKEYLESELMTAIFAGDEEQDLVPRITLHTDTPHPKLEEYLRKHAVRRYSKERYDGKLEPGDVKLIVAYKKNPWSGGSVLSSRIYFWRLHSLYVSDKKGARNETISWLANAFDVLSRIPSPILAFDAKQLQQAVQTSENDISYVNLLMEPANEESGSSA